MSPLGKSANGTSVRPGLPGGLAKELGHRLVELAGYARRLELRLQAGRNAIAEWELDHGPLTSDELADGLARARSLLGRTKAKSAARRSA